MRKIICATSIFFLHLSLLGCDSDIFDVMNSRKNIVIQYFALYKLLTNPTNPEPGSCNSISQYGITWTFDKEYQYGQFANGDYWVLGPVKVIGIDPQSVPTDGVTDANGFTPGHGSGWNTRTMNGAMINPSSRQGFDSELGAWVPGSGKLYSSNYDANYNVAKNISIDNPLIVQNGNSLFSTVSYLQGTRPQLSDAAVLTVLDSAPPKGSFRPPYAGTDKTVRFNLSDIRYEILPSLPLSGITTTMYFGGSSVVAQMKRPHVEWYGDRSGWTQYISPVNNMPGYGRQYQILISEASAMLISDSTDLSNIYGVTKEDLAIGIIQTAIDLYALVKQNKYWGAGGNLNHGRKWPILFAGLLLNDADMKNISSYPFIPVTPSNGADITNPFAEEQTHFYVSQSQINATHVPYWGDQSHSPYVGPDYRVTAIPYTSTDLELPEWGIDNTTVMTADNNNWATLYRQECGCGICGYVLAALAISGAKALYNKPEFFDYCDRYMTVTTKNTSDRQWSRFCEQMWDAYRADYGLGYVSVLGGVRQYETPSLSNGIIK